MNALAFVIALFTNPFPVPDPELRMAIDRPALYSALHWPKATKEMTDLVNKDLGDEQFTVREAGTKKLKNMGWKAMGALHLGTKNEDPEIRQRCNGLIKDQMNHKVKDYPSVFKIDAKTTFTVNGKKITIHPKTLEHLYKKRWDAYREEKLRTEGWIHDDTLYNWEVGPLATHDLMQALLIMGVDKEEVLKTFEKVENNPMTLPEGMTEYEGRGCGLNLPRAVFRVMNVRPPIPALFKRR